MGLLEGVEKCRASRGRDWQENSENGVHALCLQAATLQHEKSWEVIRPSSQSPREASRACSREANMEEEGAG